MSRCSNLSNETRSGSPLLQRGRPLVPVEGDDQDGGYPEENQNDHIRTQQTTRDPHTCQ